MLPTLKNRRMAKSVCIAALASLSLVLAACGGGGGSAGATVGVGSGGSGGTITTDNKLSMAIVDGGGAAITSLSGGQSGVVRTTLTDSAGKPIASAIVKFSTSDTNLIQFTPASGSALTDAGGVAVMTIKPVTISSSGALTITADATVGSKTATASMNMAVGAAPLTLGTLSFSPAQAGTLPAFSAVALNIPVTSGGAAATSVTGLTLSSRCVGDGTATLVLGSLANGIQSATYTNNGCLRGTDEISASVGSSTQTISIAVGAANIGVVQFVGTDLQGQSIVLKGSGGLGRKEAALLTFKVIDQNNVGLAGVDVTFTATTTTGGLTVLPVKGTTDANGNVTTTVSSGTIPTPVRVIAQASRNGKIISGLSDALSISTGLPIQRFMSLTADAFNFEGLDYDNEIANITVLMADQYGNPISDGTAVNFVTEGGAVGSSQLGACTTTNGGCTVPLKSQQFKPVNGRVTVLAYVQGIEDFVDANGDGQYTCTNFTDASGAIPAVYRPLVDICVSGGEPFTDQGDPFLDTGSLAKTSGWPAPGAATGTLDGHYDQANADLPFPYNRSVYSAAGDGRWGINYISRSMEMIFSGSAPLMTRLFCDPTTGVCRDWVASDNASGVNSSTISGVSGAGCVSKTLTFRLYDVNNNPLPFGTAITGIDADKVSPQTISPNTVRASNAIGGTRHDVSIKPDEACSNGQFSIKVTTPNGDSNKFDFFAR